MTSAYVGSRIDITSANFIVLTLFMVIGLKKYTSGL